MNRRDFLRQAAGAVAGVVTASLVPAKALAASDPLSPYFDTMTQLLRQQTAVQLANKLDYQFLKGDA